MQFEFKFLYFVHELFYQKRSSTNASYCSGLQKNSLGSENMLCIPVHSLLTENFGFRGVAQLVIFVVVILCFASCRSQILIQILVLLYQEKGNFSKQLSFSIFYFQGYLYAYIIGCPYGCCSLYILITITIIHLYHRLEINTIIVDHLYGYFKQLVKDFIQGNNTIIKESQS